MAEDDATQDDTKAATEEELSPSGAADIPAVQVCVRLRPLLDWERAEDHKSSYVDVKSGKQGAVTMLPKEGQEPARDWEQGSAAGKSDRTPAARTFQFDAVFGPETSQADVWQESQLASLVHKVAEGFNATVFAYGMTGSGKTFTMEGGNRSTQRSSGNAANRNSDLGATVLRTSPEQQGLVTRAVAELFARVEDLQAADEKSQFSVKVSYLQVYKEKIYDLLNPVASTGAGWSEDGPGLRLRWDAIRNRFYVQNLFEHECSSAEEVLQHHAVGTHHRQVAATALNATSSRSHTIFLVTLTHQSRLDVQGNEASAFREVVSSLSLVDLAGSERAAAAEQTARFKEAVNINQSLFVLRRVVTALSKCSDRGPEAFKHVPYRESKLTSLLQHAIGGNSFMLMMACLSPADRHWEENLSTLQYATQAACIRNEPKVNLDPKDCLIQQLREQLDAAHAYILRNLGVDELPPELVKVAAAASSTAARPTGSTRKETRQSGRNRFTNRSRSPQPKPSEAMNSSFSQLASSASGMPRSSPGGVVGGAYGRTSSLCQDPAPLQNTVNRASPLKTDQSLHSAGGQRLAALGHVDDASGNCNSCSTAVSNSSGYGGSSSSHKSTGTRRVRSPQAKSAAPAAPAGPWAASAVVRNMAIAASDRMADKESKPRSRKPSLPPQPKRLPPIRQPGTVLVTVAPAAPQLGVYLQDQASFFNKSGGKGSLQRSCSSGTLPKSEAMPPTSARSMRGRSASASNLRHEQTSGNVDSPMRKDQDDDWSQGVLRSLQAERHTPPAGQTGVSLQALATPVTQMTETQQPQEDRFSSLRDLEDMLSAAACHMQKVQLSLGAAEEAALQDEKENRQDVAQIV
eukprot:TRINITY_DN3442_c0_g1_i1.p1 TRINITY_DN3442_c0_g1~~TRINITY_DN3442_c0_g1_i1.p1  ORF type:complete len:859 (-),score=185.07 TRINITY_DN3442_c0_g1_i1:333-2909(-)